MRLLKCPSNPICGLRATTVITLPFKFSIILRTFYKNYLQINPWFAQLRCSLENVVSLGHLGLFAADKTRTTRLRGFVALMWLDEGHIDLTRLAEKPRHCLRWRSDQNYMRHPLSSKQTSFDRFSSYILSPPLYKYIMVKWVRKVLGSRLNVSHINSHDQKVTYPCCSWKENARFLRKTPTNKKPDFRLKGKRNKSHLKMVHLVLCSF